MDLGENAKSLSKTLKLGVLAEGIDRLSASIGGAYATAASVCLTEEGHSPGVMMSVRCHEDLSHTFGVDYDVPTRDDHDSLADPIEATALGATGIALLTVRELTGLTVVRRSVIGTGFDWWLGKPGDLLFQEAARLEISGIRKSGESVIRSRLKKKTKQSEPSDSTTLPAFAAVVEFSRPTTRIAKR